MWIGYNPQIIFITRLQERRGGLVVGRRTPEPEVGGSILTRVAVLYPSARFIYLPKSNGNTQEAVAPSDMTEKLLTGS